MNNYGNCKEKRKSFAQQLIQKLKKRFFSYICGPVLQTKAEEIATEFEHDDFKCSKVGLVD